VALISCLKALPTRKLFAAVGGDNKRMPDNNKKQQKPGFASFDKNRFMYEVADEIRTGVNEDKKKTAPGHGYETTKPFEKEPIKKAFEEKKDVGWEKKEASWEKKDKGCDEHK
jgi:hypothetical protein